MIERAKPGDIVYHWVEDPGRIEPVRVKYFRGSRTCSLGVTQHGYVEWESVDPDSRSVSGGGRDDVYYPTEEACRRGTIEEAHQVVANVEDLLARQKARRDSILKVLGDL